MFIPAAFTHTHTNTHTPIHIHTNIDTMKKTNSTDFDKMSNSAILELCANASGSGTQGNSLQPSTHSITRTRVEFVCVCVRECVRVCVFECACVAETLLGYCVIWFS